MIAHEGGVSCFKLISSEGIDLCPLNHLSNVGKFSDLMLYGKRHAYGIL